MDVEKIVGTCLAYIPGEDAVAIGHFAADGVPMTIGLISWDDWLVMVSQILDQRDGLEPAATVKGEH